MEIKIIFGVGVVIDHSKFLNVKSVNDLQDAPEFDHLSKEERIEAEKELFKNIKSVYTVEINDEKEASEEV